MALEKCQRSEQLKKLNGSIQELIGFMEIILKRFSDNENRYICLSLSNIVEHENLRRNDLYNPRDIKEQYPLFGEWVDRIGNELSDEFITAWIVGSDKKRPPSMRFKREAITEFIKELKDRLLLIALLKEIIPFMETAKYQEFLCVVLQNQYYNRYGSSGMHIKERFSLFGTWVDKIGNKLNPGEYSSAWTYPGDAKEVSNEFKIKKLKKFIKKLEMV